MYRTCLLAFSASMLCPYHAQLSKGRPCASCAAPIPIMQASMLAPACPERWHCWIEQCAGLTASITACNHDFTPVLVIGLASCRLPRLKQEFAWPLSRTILSACVHQAWVSQRCYQEFSNSKTRKTFIKDIASFNAVRPEFLNETR